MADPVFHLFPSLPIELRLKIWSYTLILSPRVVEITDYGSLSQHSRCPLPSPLKACRESRNEVIKQYDKIDCDEQTLLFNPSIDTLMVLTTGHYNTLFERFVGLQLRYLAISSSWLEDEWGEDNTEIRSLAKLTIVETITIVVCT